MKKLIALLAAMVFIVGSCAPGEPISPNGPLDVGINLYHDTARHVTCWIYIHGGISCLPDNEVFQP